MNYTLTEHAKKVLAEREIPLEWLERVLNEPVLCQSDPASRWNAVTGPSPNSKDGCSGWWLIPRLNRFA